MSKLTLDEAIKHCLEVAERQEFSADDKEMYSEMLGEDYKGFEEGCRECAADHRQLAEWLTDYKDLREENKVLMHECDRLIKEKGELLKKLEQVAEYKRLLKSAINILKRYKPCDGDYDCSECIHQRRNCGYDDRFKWRYADVAKKLLGDETNGS